MNKYINDLSKIVNKTQTPIISADDTSILFAHSNLRDFNTNINIAFATLNKRFRANQLSLILIRQIMHTLQLREICQLTSK